MDNKWSMPIPFKFIDKDRYLEIRPYIERNI